MMNGPFTNWELSVNGLRDMATVIVDGKYAGILMRGKEIPKMKISTMNKKAKVQLLVENLGRVNFSPYLDDADKGITGGVMISSIYSHGWKNWPLPLSNVPDVPPTSKMAPAGEHLPGFYRGSFSELMFFSFSFSFSSFSFSQSIFPPSFLFFSFLSFQAINENPVDTFLDTQGWKKGVMWVNGHNLGRYWQVGPQRTLYIPGVWLKTGENIIDVFEIDTPNNSVNLINTPILG